jgi:NMD protein affecting ribosome stability and mRNA decay
MFTLSTLAVRRRRSTLRAMNPKHPTKIHEHVAQRVHVLLQRAGVPYEMERQVCSDCSRVLDEKPVRRTAA